MVAAILSCAVLALIFLVLLKLVDAFREMAFEVRQTQRSIEEQTVRIEAKLDQLTQAASSRNAEAQRSEEGSRPMGLTLDEIIEKLG